MNSKKAAMTFSIRFWAIALAALLIYQFSTEVSADNCKYEKDIGTTLDLSGSDALEIIALAGDLDVSGVPGSDQAVISGKVCVSKQEWLDDSEVITTAGNDARIEVDLPNSDGGWSSWGGNYVYLDLTIEVPDNMPLHVKDSSGDILLRRVASADIKDSSGDIEIENALGFITVRDSSGDIDIDGVDGDVTIESDSSGDIEVEDVNGSMLVVSDSSGDIEATDISNDFIVEKDSSGDISANDVGGDFRVLKDGSGSINSRGVEGSVDIPEKD